MKFSPVTLLISLSLFLLPFVVNQDLLPALFSYQDPIDPQEIMNYQDDANVLGETTDVGNKRIEVDLTTQHAYAYEGDTLIYDFIISSGKWGRTHAGEYTIWAKVPKQKMSGGSKELGTYYYLPNVPYIMFFYNKDHPKAMGYSFHGTYWHNNFGVPMSHGCVNMKTPEAQVLYNWAPNGTPVTIYGKWTGKLAQK